jgi:hypothetical protein
MAAPLDQVALAAHTLARQRQPGHGVWLFPAWRQGERVGRPARRAAAPLGVPSALTARNAAWSALALEAPAVGLAEKLGIATSTAEWWHAALGGDLVLYV